MNAAKYKVLSGGHGRVDLARERAGDGERALVAVQAAGAMDAAVLDVNLDGERSFADALAERRIPFVFATGYGSCGLRDDLRDRPVLQKPFRLRELKRVLDGVFAPG